MTRLLLASVAVLALAGVALPADDPPGPKIDWPDVKGLERQKILKFGDDRLGYSVAYVGDTLVLTVFVYNLDLNKISSDPTSDAIKAEMYESTLTLEAKRAGRMPRYKSIQPLDEKVIPFGSNKAAPQLRRKRYEVDVIDEGAAITELYLTAYQNYFIKIRTTYPADGKEKSEKLLAELIDKLGKGLK